MAYLVGEFSWEKWEFKAKCLPLFALRNELTNIEPIFYSFLSCPHSYKTQPPFGEAYLGQQDYAWGFFLASSTAHRKKPHSNMSAINTVFWFSTSWHLGFLPNWFRIWKRNNDNLEDMLYIYTIFCVLFLFLKWEKQYSFHRLIITIHDIIPID